MSGFEMLWKAASGFRKTSPELRGLLQHAYAELTRSQLEVEGVRTAIEQLLVFLTTAEGRTDANCSVTDAFFARSESWSRANELPGPYRDLIGSLSGALHDTIHAPEIARTFDSTPEQLLQRLRSL